MSCEEKRVSGPRRKIAGITPGHSQAAGQKQTGEGKS